MNRKEIKIGLFGFGCVGYGLYEVIQKTPNLNAEILEICVKDKQKQRPIPIENFTFDKSELLQNPAINTIVELIDDADEAYQIVKQAIQSGKSVVTANKKMLAEHLEELVALQRKHNVSLLYEASCCASIPIIRNLEEYYDNDLLEKIEGIVNGSTNYILTNTVEKGISYQEALTDAQAKGYAESNPVLDTGGFDAKYKLLILIAHAFGVALSPDEIFNYGIDKLGDLELNYAREKGYKIKLIAFAEKLETGAVKAFVLPKFIPKQDALYSVDDVYNGIKTSSYFSEKQFFVGKGAGAYSTASAVISDISALSYDYKYEYKKWEATKGRINNQIDLKVFLKYDKGDTANYRNYFSEVIESYENAAEGYIIGYLNLEELIALSKKNNTGLSVLCMD